MEEIIAKIDLVHFTGRTKQLTGIHGTAGVWKNSEKPSLLSLINGLAELPESTLLLHGTVRVRGLTHR